MIDLKSIVKAYRKDYFDDLEDELKDFRCPNPRLGSGSWYIMTQKFIMARPDHKKRKYRKHLESYKKLYPHLTNSKKKFKKCKSFIELMEVIQKFDIIYIGSLTTYDTSLALGCYFNIYPEYIYVHSIPEKSAKIIFGTDYDSKVKYLNADKRFPYFEVKDFPKEFHNLEPYHIENLLCCCHEQISEIYKHK